LNRGRRLERVIAPSKSDYCGVDLPAKKLFTVSWAFQRQPAFIRHHFVRRGTGRVTQLLHLTDLTKKSIVKSSAYSQRLTHGDETLMSTFIDITV
jgi:hypothetical protein